VQLTAWKDTQMTDYVSGGT